MASIERTVDVHAPVTVVFNHWTRFEAFPTFMEGIERVEQLDAEHLRFHGDFGAGEQTWEARILEEIPDLLISWGSTSGPANSGTATFSSDFGDFTRVSLVVEYEPDQLPDALGDKRTAMAGRIERDLERFKAMVEGRSGEEAAFQNLLDSGEAFHP